jgi:hypothetical protein
MEMVNQFPPLSRQAAREVGRNSPLRQARTCYGHLAGVAGVGLMDALLRRGWLEASQETRRRTHFRLTLAGEKALAARGVVPTPARDSRPRLPPEVRLWLCGLDRAAVSPGRRSRRQRP